MEKERNTTQFNSYSNKDRGLFGEDTNKPLVPPRPVTPTGRQLFEQPTKFSMSHVPSKNVKGPVETKNENRKKNNEETKIEGSNRISDMAFTFESTIIGYIETKKLGTDLKKELESEQIKHYTNSTNNLILTNYTDWLWLYNGQVAKQARDNDKTQVIDIIKGFYYKHHRKSQLARH